MDAVKKAIRSALERGDAQDRAFREKVYRQAFAALDRSLQARPDLSPEDVRERRENVKATIIEIEREYMRAPAPAAPPPENPRRHAEAETPREPAATSARPGGMRREEPDFTPRVERSDRLELDESPPSPFAAGYHVRVPPAERRRRRGPWRVLIFLLVLLVAVAGVLWWMISGGIPVQRGAGGASSPPAVSSRGSAPARATDSDAGWINIFTPGDPTTVTASPEASADAINEDNETFLRIATESADASVSFDVGQGVLEQVAGRRAVFSLTARSEEGTETQISISCDFGALGDCGRTRYVVGPLPAEYLFEVEMPNTSPRAGGRIVITPDIQGQGGVLDVFSLRVTLAD